MSLRRLENHKQKTPVEEVVEEVPPIVEVLQNKQTNKPIDKVTCHYCKKQMSLASLRYSHARNCNGLTNY